MDGYFNKLIRMTGISFGPGTGSANPPGVDTAAPQPIHVVESKWIDFSPSQSDPGPQSGPTEPNGNGIQKENLTSQGKGLREILVPDSHAPAAQTDRSELRSGRQELRPDRDTPLDRGPKTPDPKPREFRETVTLDPVRDKREGPLHRVKKTNLHVPSQLRDDSDQVLQPPAKESLIHEHVEVVEVAGKDLNPPGTPFYREITDPASAPKKGHSAHSHSGQIKGENRRSSDRTRELASAEVTGGPTLEDVRQWVAQTAQPAQGSRPLNSPHTPQPDPGLLQENREFSLSIGSISVALEAPQTEVGIQRNPPAQVPRYRRRAPNVAGATPPSRLGRYYIRLRG